MKKETVKSIIILALTSWIAHFFFFKEFGFYEDDYINIPPCLNLSFGEVFNLASENFTDWSQGHPFAFVPYILTVIGSKAGGLPVLYILAYCIVTLNSIFMYFILRKVYPGSETFCLAGALMFCLFPPDTTKTFLLHAYVLQTSLMYFLISTLLYLNGRKTLSYFIILLSLLSYESAFMLFYGVPLLKIKTKEKFRKEFTLNFFILSAFLVLAFLYRKYTGEGRVSELSGNLTESLYKAIASVFLGPLMNAYLFIRGPVVTMSHPNFIVITIALIFFLIFSWLFFKIKTGLNNEITEKTFSFSVKNFRLKGEFETTKSGKEIFKLMLVSLVFLGLAYTLSFTHYPPTSVAGRLTSVHLAATFGGSMFFGCLAVLLIDFPGKSSLKKKMIFVIIISGYLSLLVGYRLVIQNDFVLSWKNQKSFWTQVTDLCPDLSDSTIIFVLNNHENKLPVTSYIFSNSWADPIILCQIYKFPDDWKSVPRVFVLNEDLDSRVKIENEELKWRVPFGLTESHWETLPDSRIILLNLNNKNELVRSDSDFISVKGKTVHLKPKQKDIIFSFQEGALHDLLILKK